MEGKDRMVGEVVVRAQLLFLGFACAVASTAFWLVVVLAAGEGWGQPLAVAMLAVWGVGSIPGFLVVLLCISDLINYVATGGTVHIPALVRIARREGELRKLAGQPAFQIGALRLAASRLAFYTNPFTPILVGVFWYLSCRPVNSKVVDDFISRLDARPRIYRVAGDVGVDWRRNAGYAKHAS